jgi:diadenosine tetraphosphate (Ap4A) HIT family hydrolase
MAELAWKLHSQLQQETTPIGDFALARLLLANDANYPWLILVPRRTALIEIIDMSPQEQVTFYDEITRTARALKDITQCEKLNIAALGNVIPELHVHVIARRHDDAAWPKPVWGVAAPKIYDPPVRDKLIMALRNALQIVPIGR